MFHNDVQLRYLLSFNNTLCFVHLSSVVKWVVIFEVMSEGVAV